MDEKSSERLASMAARVMRTRTATEEELLALAASVLTQAADREEPEVTTPDTAD